MKYALSMLRRICPRALRLRREYCSLSIQGTTKDSLIELDNLSQDNFLAPLSLFSNQKLSKSLRRTEKEIEKAIDNIGTFDFSNFEHQNSHTDNIDQRPVNNRCIRRNLDMNELLFDQVSSLEHGEYHYANVQCESIDLTNLTLSGQYQNLMSIDETQQDNINNNIYFHQNILNSADSEGSRTPNKNPEQDQKSASHKDQNDESDNEDESEDESESDDDDNNHFGIKIPLFDLFFNRP